jgi:hypothetical protein
VKELDADVGVSRLPGAQEEAELSVRLGVVSREGMDDLDRVDPGPGRDAVAVQERREERLDIRGVANSNGHPQQGSEARIEAAGRAYSSSATAPDMPPSDESGKVPSIVKLSPLTSTHSASSNPLKGDVTPWALISMPPLRLMM